VRGASDLVSGQVANNGYSVAVEKVALCSTVSHSQWERSYVNRCLFTGRTVDILDIGSLKIQYNRNRYYDYSRSRILTYDLTGIMVNPAGG
jgi:hypothetical protein